MLAILSGGGTAGHINPALALAEELKEHGIDVCFAGTPGGIEARLVPAADIPFMPFEAAGFNRKHPLSLITSSLKVMKSARAAQRWFKEIQPDVVVGFGGYVSIPVAMAAERMGIPVVVHEQNSVMGMANKSLARKAATVCVTYDYTRESLPPDVRSRTVKTGNPVRRSVLAATREEGRELLGVPDDAVMLLVFGGSLGARRINDGLIALKDDLLSRENVHIVHVTGPKELERVETALALTQDERKRWQVMGYQDRMGETLAAADVIVSRAGATSLAEIAARAIPSLLIPFPYATADHQTTNARAYVEAGCATMLADDAVVNDDGTATEAFRSAVCALLDDADLRASMRAAARQQPGENATDALAQAVCSVLQ